MKASLLALALIAASTAATAQAPAKAPEGLAWQTLDLVGFNFNFPGYQGTPDQRKLAESIWGKTINSLPDLNGRRPSAFVIQKVVETKDRRYIFSSLHAAHAIYPLCEDPPNNSSHSTPIYAKCSMRLIIIDKATGKSAQQDFASYCHISENDSEQPKSRNYAQVAINSHTNMAYYRVVMYGKPAPECDRTIHLP